VLLAFQFNSVVFFVVVDDSCVAVLLLALSLALRLIGFQVSLITGCRADVYSHLAAPVDSLVIPGSESGNRIPRRQVVNLLLGTILSTL